MHQTERLAALKRVPILAELAQAQLEQVAGACKWQDYDAAEQILSYDDPSTDVFFLASGKLRAIVYSAEGKAVIFTDLRPGAIFGEIAAIDRRADAASGREAGTVRPVAWAVSRLITRQYLVGCS